MRSRYVGYTRTMIADFHDEQVEATGAEGLCTWWKGLGQSSTLGWSKVASRSGARTTSVKVSVNVSRSSASNGRQHIPT